MLITSQQSRISISMGFNPPQIKIDIKCWMPPTETSATQAMLWYLELVSRHPPRTLLWWWGVPLLSGLLWNPTVQMKPIKKLTNSVVCSIYYMGLGILSSITCSSVMGVGAMAITRDSHTFMALGISAGVSSLAYGTSGPTSWSFKCITGWDSSLVHPAKLVLLNILICCFNDPVFLLIDPASFRL